MVGNPNGIGGWKPGESGNPSGKPKGVGEIQRRAIDLSNEALDVLAMLMRADTQADARTARLRMDAAALILDRGCGKAGQSLALTLDLKKKFSELSDDELIELSARGPELDAGQPPQIEHQDEDSNG